MNNFVQTKLKQEYYIIFQSLCNIGARQTLMMIDSIADVPYVERPMYVAKVLANLLERARSNNSDSSNFDREYIEKVLIQLNVVRTLNLEQKRRNTLSFDANS